MRQHAEVAMSYPEQLPPGQLADTVLTEGGRLAELVSAMLLLARADEGALAGVVHAVDLDDLVLAEAARLRASGQLVVESSGVSAARLRGDPGLLSQVVRNLADNAARHAAGTVRFELHDEGTRVVLAVEDDGAGIEPDERERVFERFVRLDEARARESGGSGLGLAIVRGIVSGHGGTVRVTSGELSGARFEVILPVRDLPAVDRADAT
ncbi:hypothetical protein GCM10025867_02710 [Frondihabitans sucicola]|uniref:histidine kinase n=1 Tax=Frondihabitans sucicola TaxID=1268041 RepID=A0ABM8GI19_9MICO|nr:ATP-binding protein [Frondihabitans sucicola]BDZ48030.1 hypothetical protein GCM10025867_02710 [Frondihabitans sucicola]